MRKDIAIAGFFVTEDEWESLDPTARHQLLSAVLRRDAPWPGTRFDTAPEGGPPRSNDGADLAEAYEAYELVYAA